MRMAIRVALRESTRPLDDWDKAAGKTAWTSAEIKALADIAPAVPTVAASAFLVNHLNDLDKGRLPAYVEHAARYGTDAAGVFDFIRNVRPTTSRFRSRS